MNIMMTMAIMMLAIDVLSNVTTIKNKHHDGDDDDDDDD